MTSAISDIISASRPRDGKFCGILALLLSSFLALPLAQPHLPATADGLFHLHRLMEYDSILKQGVWYSRWAPDFALGLGMPLPNFYAPLTYYLAEIFHLLGAGFIDSLKLLLVAIIMMAAFNAYQYSRLFVSPWTALVAAALYAYNPYFIVNVYYRADAAEALAFVWFPLILRSFHRLASGPRLLIVVCASLSYAALILTHNLSALLFSALLGLYLTSILLRAHLAKLTWRSIATRALAMLVALALGLAVTAFFWLPALAEKPLVAIERMLLFDFHNHFPTLAQLFPLSLLQTYSSMTQGTEVYRYAVGTVQAVLAGLGLVHLFWRHRILGTVRMEAVVSVVVIAVALFFVFPASTWLWEHFPLINLVQFPWRFLAFIALPSALLGATFVISVTGWTQRGLSAVLIALIILSTTANLSPTASNVRESDISKLGSLEFELNYNLLGTTAGNEYLPKTVKDVPIVTPLALARLLGEKEPPAWPPAPAGLTIEQQVAGVSQSVYQVEAQEPARIVLSKFNYPGWQVLVDGQPAETEVSDPHGLIALTVPAGKHTITLRFVETPLRQSSNLVSLVALVVIFALGVAGLRRAGVPRPALPRASFNTRSCVQVATCIVLIGLLPAAMYVADSSERAADPYRYPLHIDLERGITIEGYDLTGTESADTSAVRTAPGSSLALTVFWRDTSGLQLNAKPFASLLNNARQTIAVGKMAIEPQSIAGEAGMRSTRLDVAVPAWTPPGLYHIDFGLADEADVVLKPVAARRVPVYPWGWIATSVPIIVARDHSKATESFTPRANFADALRLLDVEVNEISGTTPGKQRLALSPDSGGWTVRAGLALHLNLLWQAAKVLPEDYWITVRLAGPDGFLWAVMDSAPGAGSYPPTFWAKDELVRDQMELFIAPETPPGVYELKLEVMSKGGPLSILDKAGIPVGPTINLGRVTLKPAEVPATPKEVRIGTIAGKPVLNELSILGFELDRAELGAGEALGMQLVWSATDVVRRDVGVRVQLVDEAGKVVSEVKGRPVGDSYPTSIWRKGEVLRGKYRLPVPPTAQAGQANLVVTMLDWAEGRELGATQFGAIAILPRNRIFSATPAYQVSADFGRKIRLLGYDVPGNQLSGASQQSFMASPGGKLTVAPYWQALAEMGTSFTVFVQLLNAEGRLVAQSDSMPDGGKEPTTAWITGQVVKDEHALSLPPTLSEGEYRVITGLYDARTGKRLAVADGSDMVSLFDLRLLVAR